MATRMQQRRATASQWATANPVLAAGEIGFESDTNKFKIGNGVNSWDTLDYFSTSVDLSGYYTSSETDTAISTAVANVVDTAPGVLDTLNELAAAIGDDADFVTTINTTITDGDDVTLTSAQSYADTQDAALSATITAAYEAYADGATTDMATVTYVDAQDAATLAAANAYTDSAIGDIPEVDLTGYATETYVDTTVSNLVDTAPETLNTLNELAAALGDDPNFATTVTNQIAGKQDDVITTQGDLVVGNSSGNAARLPVGSAGKIIQSNGSSVSWVTVNEVFTANTTFSTAAPSGGSDGDVWYRYI